jgi:co-chaperonin GroES (HSP10)
VFNPVNRYILIDVPKKREASESLIVLPEDYKPEEERFIEVVAAASAEDVRFKLPHLAKLVVDRSMIEEISVGGTIYNVILDNYVVGMIE